MEPVEGNIEILQSPEPLYQQPGLIIIGLPGAGKSVWAENEIGRLHDIGARPLVRHDLEGGRGSVWENEELQIWEAQEPASCYTYFKRFQSKAACQGVVAVVDARLICGYGEHGIHEHAVEIRYLSDWLNILPNNLPIIFFFSHFDCLDGASEISDERRITLAKSINREVEVHSTNGSFIEDLEAKLHSARKRLLDAMTTLESKEYANTRFHELVMLDVLAQAQPRIVSFLKDLESLSDNGEELFLNRKVQIKWSDIPLRVSNNVELTNQLSQLTAWVNVKAPAKPTDSSLVAAEMNNITHDVVQLEHVLPKKNVSSKKRWIALASIFAAISCIGAIPAMRERSEWSTVDKIHKDVMASAESNDPALKIGDSFTSPDQFCRWYLDKGKVAFPKNHQPILAKWFAKSFVSPLLESTIEKLTERNASGWDVADQRVWNALVGLTSPELMRSEVRSQEVDRSVEQVISYLAKTELYTEGLRSFVKNDVGDSKELNTVLATYQRQVFGLVSQNLKRRVDERLKSPELDEIVKAMSRTTKLYSEIKEGREADIAKAILGELENASVGDLISAYRGDLDSLKKQLNELQQDQWIEQDASFYDLLEKRAFSKVEETFDNEISFILGGNEDVLKQFRRLSDVETVLSQARVDLFQRPGIKEAEEDLRAVSLKQIGGFLLNASSDQSLIKLAEVFETNDNLLDPAYVKAWQAIQERLKRPADAADLNRRVFEKWESATLQYIGNQLRTEVYDKLSFPVIFDDQTAMKPEDLLQVGKFSELASVMVSSYERHATSERATNFLKRQKETLKRVETISKTLITAEGAPAGVDIVLAPTLSSLTKVAESFAMSTEESAKKLAMNFYSAIAFNDEKPVRIGADVPVKITTAPWLVNECSFRLSASQRKEAPRRIAQVRNDWALCRLLADKLQQGVLQAFQANALSFVLDDGYGSYCSEIHIYSTSSLECFMKWPGRFELNDILNMTLSLSGQKVEETAPVQQPLDDNNFLLPPKIGP